MHDEEAARDLSFSLRPLAIGDRRVSDVLVKETAERSKALKPDFETDVRDSQLVSSEQFFSLLDAAFDIPNVVKIGCQSAAIAGGKLVLHRGDLFDDRIQKAARLLPPKRHF